MPKPGMRATARRERQLADKDSLQSSRHGLFRGLCARVVDILVSSRATSMDDRG